MHKKWFTIFNVKVTAKAYMNKIWLFLLCLLNCWSICNQTWFDSTASLHQKPECPVEKLDYCAQGQCHSEGSTCQWMFVRIISFEPQNILLPNLVCLWSIMSQSVMQKNWFTVFSVKVTARAYIIKIWLFLLFLLNCWYICNQIWLDSTAS